MEIEEHALEPSETFKNNAKKIAVNIIHKFQSYGFWVLIIFAFGFYFGMGHVKDELNKKIAESTKLGSFIFKEELYDVKKRVQ